MAGSTEGEDSSTREPNCFGGGRCFYMPGQKTASQTQSGRSNFTITPGPLGRALSGLPRGNGALQVRRLREARKAAWAVLAAQASDTNVHNTRLQEGSATDDAQALRQARRRPPLHSAWLRSQQAVPQPVLPRSPNRRGDPAPRPRRRPGPPCYLRSSTSRPPEGCPVLKTCTSGGEPSCSQGAGNSCLPKPWPSGV